MHVVLAITMVCLFSFPFSDPICPWCSGERFQYLVKKVHRLQDGMENHPAFSMEDRHFNVPSPATLVGNIWSINEFECNNAEDKFEKEVLI